MAKSAQLARGFGQRVNRQVDSWNELVALGQRRLLEGLGFVLVALCSLIVLALLTYNPADPSLNTAVEGATGNFLGHYGAVLADLLVQGLGLSAFLLPLILIGWAFRLLLQRPLLHMPRRLLMVPLALLAGSFVGAVLHVAPIPLPAGAGGAIGWALLHVLQAAGFATLELPVALGATALTFLLMLS